ncbi:MAG: helix-turn-helix domain-containing protein [Verrucomicrobia bacterium]|nr:helix-turn-helix domain-containing protein [Verrucomicrobiota bacterium]
MRQKPVGEVWLSLEQVSQVLGLPWFTVWRWAQDGDPRLPAYKVWDESTPRRGRYRFRKQDVDALQTQAPESAPATVATVRGR